MKLLFFLYHFPPAEGSANSRNKRIAEALAQRAEKSIVFTPAGKKSISASSRLTTVHIPACDYRWLMGQRKTGCAPTEKLKSSWWAQTVIRIINTFPFSILIGEGGLIYISLLLFRGQRTIRREGITHLYSSFRPFADHYAAYCLKKWNPALIWIADFRDLIIDPHYGHILFPKWHERLFRVIFKSADILTTVSSGLAEKLKPYNAHVNVLRNGIADEAVRPVPVTRPYFTIAYTGSMFLDKRNAEPLFTAIRDLNREGKINTDKIRIIYAGKDSGIWQALAKAYRLSSILDDRGLVPQSMARSIQREACINLLLTISSDALQGVLTGKMIEYIETGSPILGIAVGQNDPELSSILEELNIGKSFSDHAGELPQVKAFILEEYGRWSETQLNRKPVKWEVVEEKYSISKSIKDLMYEL